MRQLVPAITEQEFRVIRTGKEDRIREHFEPQFRDELYGFLNGSPCFRGGGEFELGVQQFRSRWKRVSVSGVPFRKELNVDGPHWYTYHYGGQNEAQFNLALYCDHLRVGLGFRPSRARYGDPQAVCETYDCFRDVITRDAGFTEFIRDESLQAEWWDRSQARPTYIGTTGLLSGWLQRALPEESWLFVGKLLWRETDATILQDRESLSGVIGSTFTALRPYWEQTQIEYARRRGILRY